MSERQLQFRVGLFVVVSLMVGAVLILQFGDLKSYWRESYSLAVHFSEAPGLFPGSPVKQNGIGIGKVRTVVLDRDAGGVLVVVDIYSENKLRIDSEVSLVQSLLGDARLEFTAGADSKMIPPNSRLEGNAPANPLEVVQRMEKVVNNSIASFTETSQEWQKVAVNVNRLMETNEGNLDAVIERTALSLETFTKTMASANKTFEEAGTALTSANSFIADPDVQANFRKTAETLPMIAEEAKLTITTARESIDKLSKNMEDIHMATEPLAKQSDVIVRRLAGSLIQLEALLTEMNQFAQAINTKDGSMQKLAADPELYRNLNRSAASLSVLLENLNPVMNDVRIFSDKIARHPELLGVRGAMRGSSGLKESSEVKQTGGFFK